MIQIPETGRVAVAVAPPEREREPNMRTVAIVLATRMAGIGRGALAREIAEDLEAHAAREDCGLAEEYRLAAALLRREADERPRVSGRAS